ncbi:hypothetical protein BU15DRAFT_65490 [Melanogaster broomeanus]|nr:hypothetical protein BU15DRAFT_65490 [Melanogaster broomeanus]
MNLPPTHNSSSYNIMMAWISEAIKMGTRCLLQLTLYDMMQSSTNFDDVKAALNERTNWTIEMASHAHLTFADTLKQLRNVFTICLTNGGYFITSCSLLLLVIVESIHLHYGRLAPLQLKERAENMGYATFAVVIAIPDICIIIIRVTGIITVSGSPWLAFCLIFFSAALTIILPLLIHLVKTINIRISQPTVEQGEIERGEVVDN